MDKRVSQTPPKGLVGLALNYAITRWHKLIRYTENGYITPDNNAAENALRPFVIGRKNWLFAGHPNGAHAAATRFKPLLVADVKGEAQTAKTVRREYRCGALGRTNPYER